MYLSHKVIVSVLFFLLNVNLFLLADGPSVEKVEAVCVNGKTYISFKKGDLSDVSYLVYRFSIMPVPVDLKDQTPIVKLSSISHLHPDNNIAFTLPDGRVLTPNDGFFVYTPKAKENVWYCVIPEGNVAPLVVGKNITEAVLEEIPSEKPSAVLQIQKQVYQQLEDYYAIWMDYDTWQIDNSPGQWPNKTNEYYGSFFSISYVKGDTTVGKLPVIISLHALSMGGNGGYFALTSKKGFYRVYLCDHRKRWWEGSAANRINNSIDFLINNPKYNIDKDRIYLEGTSMGGHGAIFHGVKFPDKYAAIYSQVPNINPPQLDLIKKEADIPPILSYFGYKDGAGSIYNFGKKGHAPFLKKMQDNLFGVWTLWLDEAHTVPKDMSAERSLTGGYLRFKRNEVFPVFINTSTDENCGQKGEEGVVSVGQVNQKIDWSSSLHPLDIPESAIVDKLDEFSMTFKSLENCTTDLAFRRIQSFIVLPGKKLAFKNIDILTSKVIQEGEVIVPPEKIWVLKSIQVLGTGNKITIRSIP
jgi:pimeloyl-ACP methyl ester carboxylesterase